VVAAVVAPRRSRRSTGLRWSACLAAAAFLAACEHNEYQAPPTPKVTVAVPVSRVVTTYGEFTGRTVSVEAVDIRARVQGYLKSLHFRPGTDVTKGDLLFVIEPDLYEARVQRAEADLSRAEATAKAADEQLEITQTIFQRNAGSKADLVQKTQARDEARAAVARARADLAAAQLDLSYTRIFAPISGRIDRNYVDVGNLVGSGEASILAKIVREQPIYAYFDVSERDLLYYRDLLRSSGMGRDGQPIPVDLGLSSEDGYPHAGTLDYSSNQVDPSTGTIELRAIFPNKRNLIFPGLFVRLRVPFTTAPSLLVPDDAVLVDQAGRYVLVVGADDVVQLRRVKPGALSDGMRVIESGLAPTDRVVVSGLQRARPGAKVDASLASPTPATPTPAAGSPAAPAGAASDGEDRDE
jgi:RND family efflux transporter MFP subunit